MHLVKLPKSMVRRIRLILVLILFSGILLSAQEPDWKWIKSWQTGAFEVVNDMVTDPDSDCFYIVGDLGSAGGALFPAESELRGAAADRRLPCGHCRADSKAPGQPQVP